MCPRAHEKSQRVTALANFNITELITNGMTNMGSSINVAMDQLIKQRKSYSMNNTDS
jgi:uncharacterized protein YegL